MIIQFRLKVLDAKRIEGTALTFSLAISGLMINALLPIGLISSIARDFDVSEALAGQSITLAAIGALAASLFTAQATQQIDKKRLISVLSILFIAASLLVFYTDDFIAFLVGRGLLGIIAGSFQVLTVLTVRKLIPETQQSQALTIMSGAVFLAIIFAVLIGIVLEEILDWRGALLLTAAMGLLPYLFHLSGAKFAKTQESILPPMLLDFCKRPNMKKATLMISMLLGGSFTFLIYIRTFLQSIPSISIPSMSVLIHAFSIISLLGLLFGQTVFLRKRYWLLFLLPFCLGSLALMLVLFDKPLWVLYSIVVLWGFTHGPFLVGWIKWFTQNFSANSSLVLISVIQLSIALGAAIGGAALAILGTIQPLVSSGALLVLVPLFSLLFLSKQQINDKSTTVR